VPAARSGPTASGRLAPPRRAVLTGLTFSTSGATFTAIYLFQFLALLLPRDGGTAAIIYASPLVTTVALVATRLVALRSTGLLAMLALLLQNLLLVAFGLGPVLNLLLSLATYSAFYLLMLAPVRSDRGSHIVVWERLLQLASLAVVAIGVAQLVAAGFPLRLPYIDFSPDVFEGPYGAGGHRLVPMLTGPALVLQVLRVMNGAATLRRSLPLLITLAFGTIAPGANAIILALVGAVALTVITVGGRRYLRTLARGGKLFRRRLKAQTVAVVSITVTAAIAFFLVTGLGGLPHIQRSLANLVDAGHSSGPRNAKVAATLDTLFVLPAREPLQPAVGVGLGNYSSWSQLLLSGVYVDRFLRGRISGLPVSYDDTAWDLVLWHISPEAYARYGRWYVESISTQPWSSWQSLYAEAGLLGLSLLMAAFLPLLGRLRTGRGDPPALVAVKLTLGVYVWFAFVCGFIDNFFEYPWLLVPLFLGLLALPPRKPGPAEQ